MKWAIEFEIPNEALNYDHPVGKTLQDLFRHVKEANGGEEFLWREGDPDSEWGLT